MTIDECVELINNIPKFGTNSTIDNTRDILGRINFPKEVKIIHIAGTNGKGSTSSYIDSILRSAGKKTGLFTSPHLVRINERIVFDNEMISDEDFVDSYEAVVKIIKEEGDLRPSFFELIFLIAMHYYAKVKPDYLILETGLGGRLDATNAVSDKVLSVITGIGFDHMEYLGDTLELIAGEKAGIIRHKVPVAYFDQKDETKSVIEAKAKAESCECAGVCNDDIQITRVTKENIDFSVRCSYYMYESLHINTVASYQVKNASLAVLAVSLLKDDSVSREAIYNGLENAKWKGRMERILPNVYIDGAHNPHGIKAFVSSVKAIKKSGERHLIFSVVADKQYEQMVDIIYSSRAFDQIHVVHIDTSRALDMGHLTKVFARYPDLKVDFAEDAYEALKDLISTKKPEDEIFVTGSLYLVGELLAKGSYSRID